MITSPAFRYHGGTIRLSPWARQHLPEHHTYVKPFGGAAGVLLNKSHSYPKVSSDLEGDVVNFFHVLQDVALRGDLIEKRVLAPCARAEYARAEFDQGWEPSTNPVERACPFLIRAQVSIGFAVAKKDAARLRIDFKSAYGTAQLWIRFPDSLATVAERFTAVLIESRPAVDIASRHDKLDTLHYVDPPSMHSVRMIQSGKSGSYRHEKTETEHDAPLTPLRSLRSRVVISRCRKPLYDELISDWSRVEITSRIPAGCGCATRTECPWISQKSQASVPPAALPLEKV